MHRRVIMCYYIQHQCLSTKFLDQLWILNKLVKINDMFSLPQFYTLLSHNLLPYAGPKLGKLLALFPILYNSGGTCIILIITGGKTLDLIFKTLCDRDAMCHAKSLTNCERPRPRPVLWGCWAKPTWMGGVVLLSLKMEVRLVIFSPLD